MENKIPCYDLRNTKLSDLEKAANQLNNVAYLGRIYKNSEDYKERRKVLRLYYDIMKESIEKNTRINTLKFPFDAHFSPIEHRLFHLSLIVGKLNLFPEYPVGKIYLDFAIPRFKINIECDGKEFHNDLFDKFRDSFLINNGWIVFRISGSAIMKSISEINDGKGIREKWDDMQYFERGEYGSDFKQYLFSELDLMKLKSGEALLSYIRMAYIERYLIDDSEDIDFEEVSNG